MFRFNHNLFSSLFAKCVSYDKNNNIYFRPKEEINQNNILDLTRLIQQITPVDIKNGTKPLKNKRVRKAFQPYHALHLSIDTFDKQ